MHPAHGAPSDRSRAAFALAGQGESRAAFALAGQGEAAQLVPRAAASRSRTTEPDRPGRSSDTLAVSSDTLADSSDTLADSSYTLALPVEIAGLMSHFVGGKLSGCRRKPPGVGEVHGEAGRECVQRVTDGERGARARAVPDDRVALAGVPDALRNQFTTRSDR